MKKVSKDQAGKGFAFPKQQVFDSKVLQALLALIAPGLCFQTIWEPDHDAKWDFSFIDGVKKKDYRAWQSEVRVTVVSGGRILTGSAYMGGTWERRGADPVKSNPEISGYYLQMAEEAVSELSKQLGEKAPALRQCQKARRIIKAFTKAA